MDSTKTVRKYKTSPPACKIIRELSSLCSRLVPPFSPQLALTDGGGVESSLVAAEPRVPWLQRSQGSHGGGDHRRVHDLRASKSTAAAEQNEHPGDHGARPRWPMPWPSTISRTPLPLGRTPGVSDRKVAGDAARHGARFIGSVPMTSCMTGLLHINRWRTDASIARM